MTRTLRLGADLALPLDAVTETFGILAVRGAGKSNAAAVMAEEMFAAKLPFVVIDPVGSWWGLRSAGDGKGPGLALPIFGGKHGDVPLERGGGQVVADLVVDQRLSCVLDLSTFESEAAKKQFLLDFAKRLYQRNEAPLHLFLEEADDYIPQRPMGPDENYLLRAWENIVRRGRARGLGMTLITQRSAALNKNVLTQVQTLIAMRTTGPQDRKAIEEWVKYHAQSQEIISSLAGLHDGDAWVWSPDFLRKTVRTHFRRRETFDSGATPKAAAAGRAPATLADVDLVAIQERMAATIAKAKAEDPKELRRQLAEKDRRIRELESAKPAPAERLVVEVPALPRETLERLEEATGRALDAATMMREAQSVAARILDDARQLAARAARPGPVASPSAALVRDMTKAIARKIDREITGPGDASLGVGERRILAALAQRPEGLARESLTVMTGYKRSSRDTYIQRLRSAGLAEPVGDRIAATDAGVRALGADFEPLPTGDALRDYWLERLPAGEKVILEALIHAYPKPVERDRLSERTGYLRSSRDTYLQRLKARQLVELVGRGEVRASEELFS